MSDRGKSHRLANDLRERRMAAKDLAAGYAAMAADHARETEAIAWCEALIADVSDEPIDAR